MNTKKLINKETTLRMTYPNFVFRILCNEGYTQEKLLDNTGLTKEFLSDPDFQTGLLPLSRLFLNAIEQSGEPHLGIRLALKFEASFIGLPAYAAMNAATFADALMVLTRYFALTFPAITFTFPDQNADVRPGEVAIRLRPKLPLGDISYFASVSALVACEGLCKAILRIPEVALRGELSTSKPDGWADVEKQVSFPVRFDAPDIRLFLPSDVLTRQLPGADPLNHRRLLALCDEVARRENSASTPVDQVTSFLQDGRNITLNVAEVASALGYSERGLRRQLQRAGTTFRTLSNEIRERRARALLSDPTVPIKTIADELGFDTPSNFTRSFKLWTGSSPLAFRVTRLGKDRTGQN